MWIERIGLEHHGDPALCGRNVIHDLSTDFQRAPADLFQTSDHAKERGFPAARWANENDQLAFFDVEVDVL